MELFRVDTCRLDGHATDFCAEDCIRLHRVPSLARLRTICRVLDILLLACQELGNFHEAQRPYLTRYRFGKLIHCDIKVIVRLQSHPKLR